MPYDAQKHHPVGRRRICVPFFKKTGLTKICLCIGRHCFSRQLRFGLVGSLSRPNPFWMKPDVPSLQWRDENEEEHRHHGLSVGTLLFHWKFRKTTRAGSFHQIIRVTGGFVSRQPVQTSLQKGMRMCGVVSMDGQLSFEKALVITDAFQPVHDVLRAIRNHTGAEHEFTFTPWSKRCFVLLL